MKNRRDILIIAGLFLALILFVAFGPGRRPPDSGPSGTTTHSSDEDGALALYDWARALGYDARRLEYRAFTLDEGDAALVILNPRERIDRTQSRAILDWVERGGTLIFADDASALFSPANALLDELEVETAVYSTSTTLDQARPAQPALDQPPFEQASVQTGRKLILRDNNYVNLLGDPNAVVVAGIKHGDGYIYLSAAAHPFTNAGLRDPENAALALNMLRRVPAGGRILFDEYHHGFFTPPSTTRIVFGSPWGWAAAYAVLALALYLILSGRRFGRPVPLREEVARRSSAEYVESMADLFQRGGKRAYILSHYHAAFKRRLAKPLGVNPQLPNEEFTRELARHRELDEQALLAMLAQLRAERLDENTLVQTVASADRLAEELAGKR
ncbi:MAG TPA: DUF4350 domain-containing protein [Roseiflexaceae bacterium]|nr:DUF4350 domain-containing protein [Roseiflexaceae bacterium]